MDSWTIDFKIFAVISGIVFLFSGLQWLGYRFIAKVPMPFWKLVGKSIIGFFIVLLLLFGFNEIDRVEILNQFGIVGFLLIFLFFVSTSAVLWIISISSWSKNFNFKQSGKASLFNLIIFFIPFVASLENLPTRNIKELNEPELINPNTCITASDCKTNIDSTLNSIKNKETVFQYINDAHWGRVSLQVYKMPDIFDINTYLSFAPENIMNKSLADFLKSKISYGDSSSLEYTVLKPFLDNQKIEKNGLNLMKLAEYLRNINTYNTENRYIKFFFKNNTTIPVISISNYTFVETAYGKRNLENESFDCGGYILQIFYDKNNKLLVLFKMNKGCYDGP